MNEINDIKIDAESNKPYGILLINKPVGITSHDVVDIIRRKYQTKKVGHGGTLDPFAEGLLVIGMGKYTKKLHEITDFDKQYLATVILGATTETLDPESDVTEVSETSHITDEMIENALQKFTPKYTQVVPVFSSVKVNGDALRKLVRKYERFEITEDNKLLLYSNDAVVKTVDIPSREVEITEIDLKNTKDISASDVKGLKYENPNQKLKELKVLVSCSKGTYIRQLAFDIGKELGIPAMLSELVRTKIGDFKIEDAISLE